ncbi:MAG: efflux RND transporter periplasmic adaptor subunit [Pseudorhodobacter sp.]
MMGWLKQLLVVLILAAGAFWLWLAYVPSARPMLAASGVAARLESWGIPLPTANGAEASANAPAGRGGGGRPAISVLASPPGTVIADDRVTAIGTGEAARSVAVSAQVAGRIEEVFTRSGQRVDQGDLLIRLENEAETIAVERARLVLEDEETRSARITRLQGSGVASETQITEAELALRQARLALRQAEFDLSRRNITAPIDGWVGILRAEPGQQVSPADPITRIDDRSAILVDFRIPERFVGRIAVEDALIARPLALRDTELDGRITAIDNRVDDSSRTILIEATLENTADRLRPGMAFEILLSLPGESFLSVDPLSVQWGSDGAYVWRIRDNKAERAPIRIVQRNADAVLVEGNLVPDDQIVTEGVQSLRPGAAVSVHPPRQSPDPQTEG